MDVEGPTRFTAVFPVTKSSSVPIGHEALTSVLECMGMTMRGFNCAIT